MTELESQPRTSAEVGPAGFLSLTLHAHLPYVINHGTWPHGMEWLLEAAAETYLPLLRVLGNLERDGIGLFCNLNLSPILLEQLRHPVFVAEFPKYLARKIVAAREDEAFFQQCGESHYAETARFWRRFFEQASTGFEAFGQDIVGGFRHFHEAGLIDIVTCAATHGYLPLLGTDESVRAQVRMGVATHERHLGGPPRGMWSPECGYRPAGLWSYPVPEQGAPFSRIGTAQALAESGIRFFYVDTHLVEETVQTPSPYATPARVALKPAAPPGPASAPRDLYHPYRVEDEASAAAARTTVFARDPRTGMQVWSGERGYPGDGHYLDFHKKRWPGGHRYWRVTDTQLEMKDKQPYEPARAAERVRAHAAHFAGLVRESLATALAAALAQDGGAPPILTAPFDAELFGHWWFEGAEWLEAVARELHARPGEIGLITSGDYLARYPATASVAMPEGSWGAGGHHEVWMNSETAWTYTLLYPAERYVRAVATESAWRGSALAKGVLQQLCRELLLLESSDWQFLITTGAARDYAELRFHTHHAQFSTLRSLFECVIATGGLSQEQDRQLREIELRDSIFPELDPAWWAEGAHAGE